MPGTNLYACKYTLIDEEDHSEGAIIITVPACTVSQLFIINITDDNIAECNESFSVNIQSVSAYGPVIGSTNTTEVIVIDDDGEYF